MRKLLIGILLLPLIGVAQDIVISSDTTVNDTWTIMPVTRTLKIINGAIVSGTGTIVNGVLDINPYVQAFDTSLTVKPRGIHNGDFSASWYGASPDKTDNTRYFQKAIDVCIAGNIPALKIQRGLFNYNTSLMIGRFTNGWQQTTLKIYGEASFWGSYSGTQLNYNGIDSFAIGFQKNKGSELAYIHFNGKWKSPVRGTPAEYYVIPFNDFTDHNGVCSDNLTGIAIDPLTNTSGSTGIYVHDVVVGNFSTLIGVSQKWGSNADILYFDRIQLGNGRVGFSASQPQEKGNIIRGINCWGGVHTLIKIGGWGAGNYTIDGGNIAGSVINLFNISQSGWFSTNISNIYAENIGSIGTLNTNGLPLSVTGCTFDFINKGLAGERVLLYSNSTSVKFNNSMFRFYGFDGVSMKFSGKATYENYKFSGPIDGGIGSVYKTNIQFTN